MDETFREEYRKLRNPGRWLVPMSAVDVFRCIKRQREWATAQREKLQALGVELDAEGRVPWECRDNLGSNPTWHLELPDGRKLWVTCGLDDQEYLSQSDRDEQAGGLLREHAELVQEDGWGSTFPDRTVYLGRRDSPHRSVFRPTTCSYDIEHHKKEGVSRGVRNAHQQRRNVESAKMAADVAEGVGDTLWNFAVGFELDGEEHEVEWFSGCGSDAEEAFASSEGEAKDALVGTLKSFEQRLWAEVKKL